MKQLPANDRPPSAYLYKYSVVQTLRGWTLICTTIGPYWYRSDRSVSMFETETEALDARDYVMGRKRRA